MSRFQEFVEVVARLRAPDGCPWDREQTPASLRPYLIEETYEVLDALTDNDPNAVCDELGDLLLQIVLHAQIASEADEFTIDDVIANVVAKMVRRHPHVFAGATVTDAADVSRQWRKIKREERRAAAPDAPRSALDGLPRELPALHAATRTGEKAARVGFDWSTAEDAMTKVREELAELEEALATKDATRIEHELGDALFALASVGRLADANPEIALRAALTRFGARFRHVEQALHATDRDIDDATRDELDALWNAAKNAGL